MLSWVSPFNYRTHPSACIPGKWKQIIASPWRYKTTPRRLHNKKRQTLVTLLTLHSTFPPYMLVLRVVGSQLKSPVPPEGYGCPTMVQMKTNRRLMGLQCDIKSTGMAGRDCMLSEHLCSSREIRQTYDNDSFSGRLSHSDISGYVSFSEFCIREFQ